MKSRWNRSNASGRLRSSRMELSEPLERRMLLSSVAPSDPVPNLPPTIDSLVASPNPVTQGAPLTLTASGVNDLDDAVASVSFYEESNGAPGLQSDDTLLATVSAAPYSTIVDTANLAPADYTFYAVATDAGGAASDPATTLATVQPFSGSISGTVFSDVNGNGVKDGIEPGLPNWTVFLDANQNGIPDPGEPSTTTDANGGYSFTGLAPGTYSVAEVPQPTYVQTSPAGSYNAAWHEDGPNPIGTSGSNGRSAGRVTGIAPSPTDPKTIYIAAAYGGVWKTINAGATWTPLTDNQSTDAMGSIAVAPSDPNTIYAGTGEANNSIDSFYGRGVLKSTDGGATWTLMGNSIFNRRSISRIAIDPTDSNTVYVAVHGGDHGLSGNFGVWKSTNGGQNWTNTTSRSVGSTTDDVGDLTIDPANPQILFAAFGGTYGNTANGIWETTNGGGTWSRAPGLPSGNAVGRSSVAISSDGLSVYAAFAGNGGTTFGHLIGLYHSADGGATWTKETNTPDFMGGLGWYGNTLAVDPNNSDRVYAASTGDYSLNLANGIIRSDNGGASWVRVGNGSNGVSPHADNHTMAFDASGNLWLGNDGGVYHSSNFGGAWINANGNLGITQFVGIAIDPNNRNIIYGGTQDNGTNRYTGSNVWTEILGGDGGQARYDPATHTVYTTFNYSQGNSGFFERSTNSGNNFSAATNGINLNDNALFYPPYIMDPNTPSRLLLGTDKVYLTTNRAASWTAISPVLGGSGSEVTALAVSPSAPNTIYVAYTNGSVYVTTNGGTKWTRASGGLPTAPAAAPALGVADDGGDGDGPQPEGELPGGGPFADLKVDPLDPSTVYLVREEFGGGKVYRTTNGGTSWTNISGNLPDLPVRSIVLDPTRTPATLYAGTDAGVFRSDNGGGVWQRYGAGLPNTLVSDLEISTAGRFLVAGTHGRGAWTVPLVDPNPAGFTVMLTPDAPSSFGKDFGNELTVGAISGSVVVQTGAADADTSPQPNVTVYLDLNRNGSLDPGEPTAITDGSGAFTFTQVPLRAYSVREVVPAGYILINPTGGSAAVSITPGFSSATGISFVNVPTTFTGADSFTVALDSSHTLLQIFQGGTPGGTAAFSIPTGALPSPLNLSFTTTPGGRLTLDFSNGNPFPASTTIAFDAGSNGTLQVLGTPGDDAITLNSGAATVSAGSNPVSLTLSNVQTVDFPGGTGGNDQLVVNGGSYTADAETHSGTPNVAVSVNGAGTNLLLPGTQHLASLTIGAGSTVTAPHSAAADGSNLVTSFLSIDPAGTLDLSNNILQVLYNDSDPIEFVAAALTTGFAGGAWNGPGINSSDAAASGFALGYADDSAGTITVKYTRAGDADLNGAIGFPDLLKLAQSYNASGGATWGQGDFNYDGAVNFADLLVLAQNYNRHVASPFGRRQFIARHRSM